MTFGPNGLGNAKRKLTKLPATSGAGAYSATRAKRIGSSTASVAAITPNAGRSAPATRSPSVCPASVPEASWTSTTTTNAPASPAKLHGRASRSATTNGNSPSRRMTGTARCSNAIKSLEAADDRFDPADDLDIARVDWRHRTILRLQTYAIGFAVEALDGCFAIEHRDDDFAIVRRGLRPNQDKVAVENGGVDHRS